MDLDLIDRGSMACPALPTCGLAVTESERGLPDVNARLRALLTRLGFDDSDAFVVRMTGAPGLPRLPGSSIMGKNQSKSLHCGSAYIYASACPTSARACARCSRASVSTTPTPCAHDRCGWEARLMTQWVSVAD